MRSVLTLGAILLTALFMAASAADAQTRALSMSGQWFQNRGPLVDIPANGGPVFCIGTGVPQTGCVGPFRPRNGGIPANNVAVVGSGTSPANFSIPTSSAFVQAGGSANRSTVPVTPIPTVIQLASQFSLMGPGLTTTGPNPANAGPATFQPNAWSQDPNQAARMASNFSWCPPAGLCVTTPYSQTYGQYRMRFNYTAGGNAFGGTMSMMLRDTAVVSINFGGTPPKVLHQLVGGTTNPTFGPQIGGNGYGVVRTITLAPGPVHSTFMTAGPCMGGPATPPGCGVITAQGAQTQTLPSSMNRDWGMPWTTGTVIVQGLAGGAGDPATTFTVMGTDSRTPLGVGQITMVAGQLTQRIDGGGNPTNRFSALDLLVMNFSPPSTPMLSAPAIGALVALLLLGGGYMARKRL